MTVRRLVIDCDPGLDDALAIILALSAASLRVEAVATVAGNADIATVTCNACDLIEALGTKTPVLRGADRPLRGEPRLGCTVWGGDGKLGLPEARERHPALGPDGYDSLFAAGPLTIAALGPLTNVARLLAQAPRTRQAIESIVLMGGAIGAGNVTPFAEFNIWADPHAAAQVFDAGIPMLVVPLNVTRQVEIPKTAEAALRSAAWSGAAVAASLLPLTAKPGHPSCIHDACAIACLLWPELFATERGTISVELSREAREGETVFAPGDTGPHRLATGVDSEKLSQRLIDGWSGKRAPIAKLSPIG